MLTVVGESNANVSYFCERGLSDIDCSLITQIYDFMSYLNDNSFYSFRAQYICKKDLRCVKGGGNKLKGPLLGKALDHVEVWDESEEVFGCQRLALKYEKAIMLLITCN